MVLISIEHEVLAVLITILIQSALRFQKTRAAAEAAANSYLLQLVAAQLRCHLVLSVFILFISRMEIKKFLFLTKFKV